MFFRFGRNTCRYKESFVANISPRFSVHWWAPVQLIKKKLFTRSEQNTRKRLCRLHCRKYRDDFWHWLGLYASLRSNDDGAGSNIAVSWARFVSLFLQYSGRIILVYWWYTSRRCVVFVDWRWKPSTYDPKYFDVLQRFLDKRSSCYSIHQIGGDRTLPACS